MELIATIPVYVFTFISLYFQVFLLLTFLEKRAAIDKEEWAAEPSFYPSVTVIIPCWNEEKTVVPTALSVFGLDYPKEKLHLAIVDDGSTDRTWEVIQRFKGLPNVKLFRKKNGGKHTALNLALAEVSTELVGCLDADSFVERDALKKIAKAFEDASVMAVTPAIKVDDPRGLLGLIQNVEYNFGIFFRKVMGTLDAIQVTPGPFSIFRKKVFDDLGPYKKAHNTEDLEIAFRMHAARYRIVNSHQAYVRTVAPATFRGLYRQRLRWVYGFLKNALDYKFLFLSKKYGNFGMFMLPAAVVSIFSVLYLVGWSLFNFGAYLAGKLAEANIVGIGSVTTHLDWFFLSSELLTFVSIILFLFVVTMIFIGKSLANDTRRFPLDVLYFLALYGFIVPSWLFMALVNTAFSRVSSWR
ncbi:glycosyltransferase family 2 protein [Candidatus Parcubacteria bacterium]|nr:glycosyltransferase family 2 protein [Candidatus Parcubacteria bacterium]